MPTSSWDGSWMGWNGFFKLCAATSSCMKLSNKKGRSRRICRMSTALTLGGSFLLPVTRSASNTPVRYGVIGTRQLWNPFKSVAIFVQNCHYWWSFLQFKIKVNCTFSSTHSQNHQLHPHNDMSVWFYKQSRKRRKNQFATLLGPKFLFSQMHIFVPEAHHQFSSNQK